MLRKIYNALKRCFGFWGKLLFASNKKEFLKENTSSFKTQLIVLLSCLLAVFVVYNSLKPVVRGACRIVLQSNDDMMAGLQGRVVGIEAKKVELGTSLREVNSIGTLKAQDDVMLKVEIPTAKIKELRFIEGARVEKGDELILFEDDYYRAEKERLEAEFTLRHAEFERVKRLYTQKVGSQKTYDEALAQMNEAKAQLDGATFQLSKTVVRAPFSGTIGIMKVSVGSIVQQHTELVNIVDNSTVKVEFMVPVKYIEDIAVGQNVDLTVDAFNDRVFSGSVDAIDSEVDVKNHSILVRAVIPNESGALKHGMFANVKLITGEKSGVILVDEDALDREGAIEFVWTIDDKGRAYRRRVLTGAKGVNGVEILAGLNAGDLVVIAGQLKLTDGSKVNILNKDEIPGLEEKKTEEKQDSDKSESSEEQSLSDEDAAMMENISDSSDDASSSDETKAESDEVATDSETASDADSEEAEDDAKGDEGGEGE